MTSGEHQIASLLPEVAQDIEESDMDVATTLAALARIRQAVRLPDTVCEGLPLNVVIHLVNPVEE